MKCIKEDDRPVQCIPCKTSIYKKRYLRQSRYLKCTFQQNCGNVLSKHIDDILANMYMYIPTELWKYIVKTHLDKEDIAILRIVNKNFCFTIIGSLWKQYIPYDQLTYYNQICLNLSWKPRTDLICYVNNHMMFQKNVILTNVQELDLSKCSDNSNVYDNLLLTIPSSVTSIILPDTKDLQTTVLFLLSVHTQLFISVHRYSLIYWGSLINDVTFVNSLIKLSNQNNRYNELITKHMNNR